MLSVPAAGARFVTERTGMPSSAASGAPIDRKYTSRYKTVSKGHTPAERFAVMDLTDDAVLLTTLLDNTDDYILICDDRARPVLWNRNYAEVMRQALGIEMEIGLQPHRLLSDEGRIRWWDGLHARALRGERFRVEYSHDFGQFGLRHFEHSYIPMTLEGRVAGFCEITRDVTQRKQLEAQLRHSQKMEAIGTLAGGIAHDFNNILTPIFARAELALRKLEATDPVRGDMTQLLSAAERAAALVKQILTISRREESPTPEPVSLGALVEETAAFFRASLPTTIEIRTEIDRTCGPVLGDPSQLQQILLNLCTNAGYAMRDKGGVLTLQLRREGDDREGRRVRLSVRDTGIGIAREDLARVFEPYFTTKPVGHGSGLGLALVHGIVTNLGGGVRLESTQEKGTTFEVWLPETAGCGPEQGAEPPELAPGDGQSVLVVDDDRAIRNVLVEMLTALGYQVTETSGGAEALAVFRADPGAFDAVLTDYTMPGMTGFELAGALLELRPDLPILLTTGFAEEVTADVVAERGIRGLLKKPFKIEDLGRAFGRVLDLREE